MDSAAIRYNLAGCRNCGQLFNRLSGQLCPVCRIAEQREMDNVVGYIRARPGADIEEIAHALAIPLARIIRYADEGVFRRFDLKVNYPCRICHCEIAHGAICLSCNDRLNRQIVDLRDKVWEQNYVRRPVEPAGNIRERRPGSWGDADSLFSSGSISTRRERDKKGRRQTGSGWSR